MQNNTTRLSALESDVAEIKGSIAALTSGIERLLAAPIAPVAPVAEATVTDAMAFRDLREALKAHKAAGHIKPGVSVKDAIAQGLMTATGTLPGAAPVAAPAAPAAQAAQAEEGTSFVVLRAALKAHKAAGLVAKGVTVKDAIASGVMLPDGTLPASGVRQVAQVEAAAPAKTERKPVGENHASQGPRDALGRITPKSQWDMREALAETGKFDRHEIDNIVASQVPANA